MLRTRLWMGAILIGLASLILLEERWFRPWFPIFALAYAAASILAVREFCTLIPSEHRPNRLIVLLISGLLVVGNWLPLRLNASVWHIQLFILVAGTILQFLWEMRVFRGPNQIIVRIALGVLIWVYLGILPSFLAQLRWLPASTAALAFAVFVPKCNDIGAYFTGKFLAGRILGRHLMTPILSPKKTWQGFAGGMLASIGVTYLIDSYANLLGSDFERIGFAFVVGLAGVLGDLAESLIKRDLQTKDASQSVPGFGGVLDVIDSLLFAAPVVYLWLSLKP